MEKKTRLVRLINFLFHRNLFYPLISEGVARPPKGPVNISIVDTSVGWETTSLRGKAWFLISRTSLTESLKYGISTVRNK